MSELEESQAEHGPCLFRPMVAELRAALAEKEKEAQGLRTQIEYERNEVRVRQKLREAAEREARGLRKEWDAWEKAHPKDEIEARAWWTRYLDMEDKLAAQAQEIKTLKEDGDHEEALAIEGALRHIALFGKYGEAQDQLAAKDRLLSEQATVIERAREALRQADGFGEQLEKIKHGYLPPTLQGWGRLLRKTIALAALPAPQPAPVAKPQECNNPIPTPGGMFWNCPRPKGHGGECGLKIYPDDAHVAKEDNHGPL